MSQVEGEEEEEEELLKCNKHSINIDVLKNKKKLSICIYHLFYYLDITDLLKNLKRYMLIQAKLVPNLTTTMEIMNEDEKNNLFDFIIEPQKKWKKKKCFELK